MPRSGSIGSRALVLRAVFLSSRARPASLAACAAARVASPSPPATPQLCTSLPCTRSHGCIESIDSSHSTPLCGRSPSSFSATHDVPLLFEQGRCPVLEAPQPLTVFSYRSGHPPIVGSARETVPARVTPRRGIAVGGSPPWGTRAPSGAKQRRTAAPLCRTGASSFTALVTGLRSAPWGQAMAVGALRQARCGFTSIPISPDRLPLSTEEMEEGLSGTRELDDGVGSRVRHVSARGVDEFKDTEALNAEQDGGEQVEGSDSVGVVRVPRILFFGGDTVSLTALEALCARLECVVRSAFARQEEAAAARGVGVSLRDVHEGERGACPPHTRRRWPWQSCYRRRGPLPEGSVEAERVRAFIRDHITVVCPYLPQNITPAEAARRYSRQFPIARYCVEQGLTVVPVDHPRSLTKSKLLADMLGDRGPAGSGLPYARQLREEQQQAERLRRRQADSLCGRLQALGSLVRGRASATAAPLLAGPSYYFTSAPKTSPPSSTSAAATAETLSSDISTPWSRHGRPLRDFDVAVVVSFRYFLPAALLEALPPTVNMHPSLLPRYRGASPIFTTLMRNDRVGGASIIQLRADQRMMDSGHVLWQCEVPISTDMDIRTYMPLVTQLGAAGLCDTIFGEQPSRTPQWCQRQERMSSAECDSGSGTEREGTPAHLTTPPPPCITPAVIAAAAGAHRRYALYCEHCATTGTVPSSPSSAQRALTCADVFPLSVRNGYCDWPDSFWFHWRTAPAQVYPTYAHLREDPLHAPLLPKDAAVLRFSRISGEEGFGVWRAFVGGQHFQPAVNATLDKACTPVRNQLARRTLRRLVREKLKTAGHRPRPRAEDDTVTALTSAATGEDGDAAKGERQQQQQRRRRTRKAAPIDVEAAASLVDHAMLEAAEADLRLSCSFTKALHPDRVPAAVHAELAEVERGRAGGSGVRFFRSPPPLLASARAASGQATAATTASTAAADGGSGLVLLRTPELRMVLADEDDDEDGGGGARGGGRRGGGGGVAVAEEAPEGYVPDVIPVAPPAPLPWLADVGEEVGVDYMATEEADAMKGVTVSAMEPAGAANAREGGSPDASSATAGEKSARVVTALVAARTPRPPALQGMTLGAARLRQLAFHIPTGTAYFPMSDESIGAIKCKEGWFFWQEAHLKYSPRAQPAVLLRKGMAMRTGVLYAGLFSEYCK